MQTFQIKHKGKEKQQAISSAFLKTLIMRQMADFMRSDPEPCI